MIPRKLLAILAPRDPINGDEMGCCIHCGGHPPGRPYGYAGRFLEDHNKGCPWVKARRLLGDKIPAGRTFDHTDLQTAWAYGAKIEYLRDPGMRDQWCDAENPSWDPHTQFRIKPE